MTHDVRLALLLRSAVPPVMSTGSSHDVWPALVNRSEARRRMFWLDVALAAAVITALLTRPELIILLAYHF